MVDGMALGSGEVELMHREALGLGERVDLIWWVIQARMRGGVHRSRRVCV